MGVIFHGSWSITVLHYYAFLVPFDLRLRRFENLARRLVLTLIFKNLKYTPIICTETAAAGELVKFRRTW